MSEFSEECHLYFVVLNVTLWERRNSRKWGGFLCHLAAVKKVVVHEVRCLAEVVLDSWG